MGPHEYQLRNMMIGDLYIRDCNKHNKLLHATHDFSTMQAHCGAGVMTRKYHQYFIYCTNGISRRRPTDHCGAPGHIACRTRAFRVVLSGRSTDHLVSRHHVHSPVRDLYMTGGRVQWHAEISSGEQNGGDQDYRQRARKPYAAMI